MPLFIEVFYTRWRHWKDYFRKHPVIGLLISALVLALYGGLFYGLYQTDKREKAEQERKRRESLSYNQQIDTLNNVQESLRNLIQFVEMERQRLKESEDAINNLKQEEAKLRPVIEADQRTIEALFELQYQKNRNDVWKERGIGFVLGLLASIIASFIYGFLRYLFSRRKENTLKPSG